MRLGIIGLSQSGKSTVFAALTRAEDAPGHRSEDRIATMRVPDERVDTLSAMYQPKKTTYAQVEYYLPGSQAATADAHKDQQFWTPVRDCDALVLVIRNFTGYGADAPTPGDDLLAIHQELLLADLMVVEKRIERLAQEKQRGRKINDEERAMLERCLELLEKEAPIRSEQEIVRSKAMKGFAFLTGKPMLVLFNNGDDDDRLPAFPGVIDAAEAMVIRGKLEHELSQMSAAEADEFLREFGVTESAMDRVLQRSYELLGLISFFTVGEDEVRAWTIPRQSPAVEAAGAIHTDMQKGFIRAEVVAYDDLIRAGSHSEARKEGTVRLEGKTYEVCNGDIINFRFNV